MKSTKWYNWVGDAIWDDYCRVAWIVVFGPCLAIIGFFVALILKGMA